MTASTTNFFGRRVPFLSEYDNIISQKNARLREDEIKRQEKEFQEKINEEKRQKEFFEKGKENDQKNIYSLAKDIHSNWRKMVSLGRDLMRHEADLLRLEEEYRKFQQTADEVFKVGNTFVSDPGKYKNMKITVFASNIFPLLEGFIAFLVLHNILISEAAVSFPYVDCETWGVPLSLFAALVVGGITRFTLAYLSESHTQHKKLLVKVVTMCIPCLYLMSEFVFAGFETLAFTLCMCFISFIIQSVIVYGNDTLRLAPKFINDYDLEKTANQKAIADKESEANRIKSKIFGLQSEISSNIPSLFNEACNRFIDLFSDLIIERENYLSKYNESPKIKLNQLIIYAGNIFSLRSMEGGIPFARCSDGTIAYLAPVSFPDVASINDLHIYEDFAIIDYMLKNTDADISLTETVRMAREKLEKEKEQNGIESREEETRLASDSDINGLNDESKSANDGETEGVSEGEEVEEEEEEDDDAKNNTLW